MPIQVLVAFLVLAVLNLFMLFILRTLSLRVSLKFRGDANRLFSNYSDILDKQKEQMLEEYKEEIKNYKFEEEVSEYNNNESNSYKFEETPVQEYRDDELFNKYLRIKSLTFASQKTVEEITTDTLDYIDAIKDFRSHFDIEKIYKIKTLDSATQFNVITSLISKNSDYKVVEQYVKKEKFEITEFIASLDFLIISNPSDTTIYKAKGNHGDYEELDSIVEGYIVSDGKKIYDFALKKGDVVSG